MKGEQIPIEGEFYKGIIPQEFNAKQLIETYRTYGTDGIKETEALTRLIDAIGDEAIFDMLHECTEVAFEILINAWGCNVKAIALFTDFMRKRHGWLNEGEAETIRQQYIKEQQKRIDLEGKLEKMRAESRAQEEYRENQKIALEEQIGKLKAQLYTRQQGEGVLEVKEANATPIVNIGTLNININKCASEGRGKENGA